MRHKNEWGYLFILLSVLSLLININPTISGGVIDINTHVNTGFFIGLIFLFLSFIIFASRQTLDAILIPTGGYEANPSRTMGALKEYYLGRGAKVFILSGRERNLPLKHSQIRQIYDILRRYKVKPKEIMIEAKSSTTLENVLFSFEKLRKMRAKDVGISSNPTQLDRFEYTIDKAKKEGLIDKDVRIHRIETSETWGQWIYGVVSNWLYRYELRHGVEYAEKHRPWFHKPIKKVLSYIVDWADPGK